jgi:hypothetical protein
VPIITNNLSKKPNLIRNIIYSTVQFAKKTMRNSIVYLYNGGMFTRFIVNHNSATTKVMSMVP